MADTRYLRQRHQGWYFVAAVPRELRGKFVSNGRNGSAGRPLSKIVVSLKTQSLGEAQDRRWPLVKHMARNFPTGADRRAIVARRNRRAGARDFDINAGTRGGGCQEAPVVHQRGARKP